MSNPGPLAAIGGVLALKLNEMHAREVKETSVPLSLIERF